MPGKDFHQQRNDTFYNQSVAFCFEDNFSILFASLQQYTALATFNQILFRLIFFVERFMLVS